MDIYAIISVILIIYLLVIYQKRKAAKNKEHLRRDNRTYEHIKRGMREYSWQSEKKDVSNKFLDAKHKEALFENADMIAYKVKHFAEFRIGFFFKEINEYGLYGTFDEFVNYYRTNEDFQKEERLIHDE